VISAELFQCVPDCEVTRDAQRAPVPPAAALLQGCAEVEIRRHGEARLARRRGKAHFLSAAHALMQLATRRSFAGEKVVAEAEAEEVAWADEGVEPLQEL